MGSMFSNRKVTFHMGFDEHLFYVLLCYYLILEGIFGFFFVKVLLENFWTNTNETVINGSSYKA